MKKNGTVSARTLTYLKIARIMKLMIALILFACLHVSAKGWSQERITLKMNGAEIKKVLFAIEKQTDYRFLFTEDAVKGKPRVSIDVVKASVSEILDKILANTGIGYKVLGSNLVVLKEGVSSGDINLQEVRITGKVTSASGDPMPGVSVVVKGTVTGTTTDANGNYSINVPDNAVLVFSSVGYETAEVSVNGKTTINVVLQLSTKVEDEIVVIGYGSASKRDLTGSIVKISGKEVADKPNVNPIASLQGKVAGLSVVNNGTPGAAPDIRIRGTVSIGQVHPLYVVDGIFNDNIDFLNPNDIESIEVLKDPSSLAIFGVKGATGVIAITTKKAKAGQTIINFNTSYGFKKLVDRIKMANSTQFNTLFAQENANNGVPTPDYSALTANTDWISAVTQTGNFNTDNLSISASTEKNRFNLGLGYTSDEGIILHEKLERMQISFSDELKVNKAIKVGINFNGSRQHSPYNATNILNEARQVMPQVSAGTKTFRVADPYTGDSINTAMYSGLDAGLQNSGVVNPLLELQNTWNKDISYTYRMVGSIYAEVDFLKYFNFRTTVYADLSTWNDRTYSPDYYAYNPITNTPYLYNSFTQVAENDNTYRRFQQDHILTFKKNFGDHSLTATAGFTTFYHGDFNRSGVAKQFTTGNAIPIPNDPRFWYINSQFQDPSNTLASSSQGEYTTVSFLGRVMYNYKGKYFLTGSIRNDASSQIPSANRNQQFWAIGAGWELTKEKFMENQKVFDFLKLKGSIGVLGNQNASYLDGTPINYPFYPNLNTGISANFGTNQFGAAQATYQPNPDLKWETVSAHEIGIEFNMLKNRLHFEGSYFNNTTNNLMTYVDRSVQGLTNLLENGGSLKNWGEELAATWNQKISKDFSLDVSGNITFLKNKVLSIASDVPGGFLSVATQNNGSAESRTMAGYPIGSFFGYVVQGLYQSYADILNSPPASQLGAYRPGDFKFKDVNGDGVISASDRTVIGNPTPKFTYGGSINLKYKNFNLGIDVGGEYGNQIFRTWGSLESPFQRVNYPLFKINSWHGSGTSNWDPIISQADRFNYNGSTYNIEDGSYFRIRNLQLGYDFNQHLISKAKLKDLRVYCNVQNLKTWKNNYGYTTEFGGTATYFGYDMAGGAIPVVVTFGLNVTF